MSVINSTINANIPPVAGRGVSSSSGKPSSTGSDAAVQVAVRDAGVPTAQASRPLTPVPQAATPEISKGGSKSAAPTKEQVNQALEDMIKRQQADPTSVQFAIDEKLNQVVIKVVDPATNKVIKQIPAEAIMKMREDMLAMDSKTPPAGALLSEKT